MFHFVKYTKLYEHAQGIGLALLTFAAEVIVFVAYAGAFANIICYQVLPINGYQAVAAQAFIGPANSLFILTAV